MSHVRNRNMTLVGLPTQQQLAMQLGTPSGVTGEDPFPLRPYDAAMSFTPSHERCPGEPTPVYIPPARRVSQEEILRRRAARQGRLTRPARPGVSPALLHFMVATVVIYATAIIVFATF